MSINRVIIVHGFGAGVDDHWFPWLADAVDAERIALPESRDPREDPWTSTLVSAFGDVDENTTIVAHSLGCVASIRALSATLSPDGRLGRFVAVAPFARTLQPVGEPDLDAFIESGLPAFLSGIDVASVGRQIIDRHVLRSDDDPVVDATASDEFADLLATTSLVVPGAGHFLADDGVTRLDEVVRLLR
ncbi:hypothetical protein SAMN04488550_4460 [Gordonia malaquae]|uniref:Hydrolase n=1 Tax=Gordonia malaquae NBRC 108250 TaxID=1223542 RepID=M3VGL1_GORML|nr:alpha/beta hydrolase [Gordonia malaquae]GAC81009.1 hypothetical protein GM1_025_00570 [Gordonia malaquae NBRC 108250]SEE39605.1 hypothetical protein SAMN04488550_4460 [Gordonia malaquae]